MMSLSAPKRAKCPCGKRATSTLMSRDGKRELMSCCAKCGLVCLEYKQRLERDDDSPGLDPAIRRWYATDSGTSSKTIAAALIPELRYAVSDDDADAPYDWDDFGRCYRLLKLIPNGHERMPEVAAKFPIWKRLVANWSELVALYEEDCKAPPRSPSKVHKRIQELRP